MLNRLEKALNLKYPLSILPLGQSPYSAPGQAVLLAPTLYFLGMFDRTITFLGLVYKKVAVQLLILNPNATMAGFNLTLPPLLPW